MFSIALVDSAQVPTRLDSVRRIAAPPIDFAATVEPDREHSQPVLVTATGEAKVLRLALASMVHRGDTLVSLRLVGNQEGTRIAIAPGEGWWRPRRYGGESVWEGDTLGTVQSAGWYRAIGPVEDGGRIPVRLGDAATIELPGPRAHQVGGTVASVAASGFGGTDVTVHFLSVPDTVLPPAIVQVTVVPGDSLLVVPSGSVVNLSFGPAVFLPRGHGVHAVQFLVVDPHASLGTVVHGGLDGPAAVASGDLRRLVAAAEESLSVIRRRRE